MPPGDNLACYCLFEQVVLYQILCDTNSIERSTDAQVVGDNPQAETFLR